MSFDGRKIGLGGIFFKSIFREGREGVKERETNIGVQEKLRSVASCTSPTRDLARNPGLCPDWDRTSDLSVCRVTHNPLSHTSQDRNLDAHIQEASFLIEYLPHRKAR